MTAKYINDIFAYFRFRIVTAIYIYKRFYLFQFDEIRITYFVLVLKIT